MILVVCGIHEAAKHEEVIPYMANHEHADCAAMHTSPHTTALASCLREMTWAGLLESYMFKLLQ